MSLFCCTSPAASVETKKNIKIRDKFQTTTQKIKKVKQKKGNTYESTAAITIKGKTEIITFNTDINKDSAVAKIKIDRTKFDVKYGSGSFFDGLGDNMIYDEFDLNINLSF